MVQLVITEILVRLLVKCQFYHCRREGICAKSHCTLSDDHKYLAGSRFFRRRSPSPLLFGRERSTITLTRSCDLNPQRLFPDAGSERLSSPDIEQPSAFPLSEETISERCFSYVDGVRDFLFELPSLVQFSRKFDTGSDHDYNSKATVEEKRFKILHMNTRKYNQGGRDLLTGRMCLHSPCPGTKFLSTSICCDHGLQLKVFASRKSENKLRKDGESSKTFPRKELPLKELKRIPNQVPSDDKANFSSTTQVSADKYPSPSRGQVLQACIGTSCLLLALGAIIRQLTHLAPAEGWALVNPSELSFDFEMWHLELIMALVVLISSSRYILLKTWPDFSKSSEAANQQILSSLEPLDYVLVAFFPGISEEFLFRGALLPLFGLNWISSLLVGAIFGALHVGSGRRYSYAIWATFVGFAYGLAAIISSSIVVPMASHSLNNLVGGLLWRITSISKKQDE